MPRDAQTVFERKAAPTALVKQSLANSQHRPFWLDDVPNPENYPQLQADHTVDLVVVGGGYLGLWTALIAKQRDPSRQVALLESRTIGWAASGRNGGFCDASITHGDANGQARWPDEMETLRRLGADNLDAIENTVKDLGIDCEFERNGMLEVAIEPYQADELRAASGEEFLSAEAVRSLVNSPTYLGGHWDRHSLALVHPAKLAHGLATAAQELGVEIFENSPAAQLSACRSDRVTITTPYGQVDAAQAALATNIFPPLLKRYAPLMVPVYDYVLMTEPLTSSQLAETGWNHRQGVGDVANQFHYYRLSADNRILWGGYDAIFKRRVSSAHEDRTESFERLASHFFTTFPHLRDVRFTHRWAGAIDTSTQFCAFHGLAKGGRVAYSSGFTGLGVGATRFAADVMLDRLAGSDTERTQLHMVRRKPLPFPPDPVKTIGVEATRWSIDRADHREGRRNLLLRGMDAVGLGFDS